MNLPQSADFIDIHTHGASPAEGIFKVENLMAHEELQPDNIRGMAFTAGIHPWHLNESNSERLMQFISKAASDSSIAAIGEAGFDKLRGPSVELQRRVFGEQVNIAAETNKPMIIHCVRSWDELLSAHKSLKPGTPWLVHGFRGKKELALQLIKRGMYISIWFEYALRPESVELIRYLPKDRFFLETDGADVDIREIYRKVSADLAITVDELKNIIHNNFKLFFKI
jgi:TatD DNase family protein